MRALFAVLLIAHLLMEAMAAVALIGGPEGISAAGQGAQWSMHYGFAALAMASISVWVWPRRNDLAAVTVALGVLLTFHVGLTLSLAVAGDQVGGMIGHAVLAAISLVLITQRTRFLDRRARLSHE